MYNFYTSFWYFEYNISYAFLIFGSLLKNGEYYLGNYYSLITDEVT